MEILEKILTEKANRTQLICEFQELVWTDENASGLLLELAYDLDFYESNEEWRKEDPSYYGEEQLEQGIKAVIKKLQEQNSTYDAPKSGND